MTSEPSFDDVMRRLQKGDPGAASAVFARFVRRLVALARHRLDQRMLRKEDPEEIVQSVYRSFFRRHADGQFAIENWDSAWALLALITLRKCGNRIEYYRAGCRDVLRDVPMQPADDDLNASRVAWEAVASGPSPSQAAMLTETVEQLMAELDDRDRVILSLKLQGRTVNEISEEAGCAMRTVGRSLDKIRRKLSKIVA
jgi:RNA polymerase sigma-70 factor, ECF subfamily